jgi:Flp pilus assembly pilin Flp
MAPDSTHGPNGGSMMMTRLQAVVRNERGQALVEYALILFFIAIVCVTVLTTLGTNVRDVLQSVADGL